MVGVGEPGYPTAASISIKMKTSGLSFPVGARCITITRKLDPNGVRMELISRYFEWLSKHALDPMLVWVLNHPIVSLVVIFVAVYVSVRNYRML
jgi:hypothetical protein